jgi:DNA-binding Xre family transcriptional regulator
MNEQHKTERRRQVEVIKKLGRNANGRGHCLPGLRAARLASAFTQRELAARSGSSQQTIHALECQDRGAYPATIRRLCVALAVEPADLLTTEVSEEE